MTELSAAQLTGAEFLRSRRVAGLFDEPGYGKTAQIVRAFDLLGFRRVAIICPPKITRSYAAEYEKWSVIGWPVKVLESGADELPDKGVVCLTYALAGYERVVKALRKWKPELLVLGEAHHVKEPDGARCRAIFNSRGIAARCSRVWFESGSPTPNNAAEYFVFAKVCGAWKGTYNQFIDRYCICDPSAVGRKIIGSNEETRPELLAMLAPHVLSRGEIEDDRAPLTIDGMLVEGEAPDYSGVPEETKELIRRAIELNDWKTLDGDAVASVDRITGIAKARGIAKLARDSFGAGHERVLIFAAHTAVIDILAESLSDFRVGIVDGRTTEKQAERVILDFAADNQNVEFDIGICQRTALKEGRTMTAATRVIIGEPFWTPDYNTQMIRRAWRRGQRKPVHASYAHLAGSLDDAKARVNKRKKEDTKKLKLSVGA